MMPISELRYAGAVDKFAFIMEKYILRLLPVKITGVVLMNSFRRLYDESQYNRLIDYNEETGALTVVPQKKDPAFVVELALPAGKSYAFRAAESILAEISSAMPPMGIYESFDDDSVQDAVNQEHQFVKKLFDGNSVYFEAITDIAFERGLANWLGGTGVCGATIFRLLHKLESWTRKTYEGKHVSFGIIVDKDSESGTMNYIEFLDNRSSALVSDGIFSAVYLDRNGGLIKSVSSLCGDDLPASSDDTAKDISEIYAPYEFAGFAGMCCNNRIGLITLSSGDILIIKDSKLIFSKRNDDWSVFDHESIINEIVSFVSEDDKDADRTRMWKYGVLAREIYKIMIDVSFSYSGGCIGILKKSSNAENLIGNNTITYRDYMAGKYDDLPTEEFRRRDAQRRRVIAGLIWYDGAPRTFDETSRKLRMECALFDGAVLVDTDGEYITVGSIVKVNGGGTGGRTLAARSLAKSGMGIKISSDGGITAYIGKGETPVFSIG